MGINQNKGRNLIYNNKIKYNKNENVKVISIKPKKEESIKITNLKLNDSNENEIINVIENDVIGGSSHAMTINKIKKTKVEDYKVAFFDFEVFNDYVCVTFMGFQEGVNEKRDFVFDRLFEKSFEFALEDTNLKEKLQEFADWFRETQEEYIFVAWNVRYDESILYAMLSMAFQNTMRRNNGAGFGLNDYTKDRIKIWEHVFDSYSFDLNKKKANELFFKELNLLSMKIVGSNRDSDEDDGTISLKNFDYQGVGEIYRYANFFDTMNVYTEPISLKVAAGQMGFNIKESAIPWDIKQTTKEQREEILSYNINDVDVLARVSFVYWPYFDVRRSMVRDYTPDNKSKLRNKNDSFFNLIYKGGLDKQYYQYNNQFYVKHSLGKYYNNLEHDKKLLNEFKSGKITQQEYLNKLKGYDFLESITTRIDEMDVKPEFHIYNTLESMMKKYVDGGDKYSKQIRAIWEKFKGMKKFPFGLSKVDFDAIEFEYRGMLVKVALGGVHGSANGYNGTATIDFKNKKTKVVMKDAVSYYIYMMIKYNLQAHWLYKKEFNESVKKNSKEGVELHQILPALLTKRLVFKKNKDPRDKSAKVLINATYGGTGATFSVLYDPISRNAISILGQISLLILCEMLRDKVEFIQINTDGINIGIKDNYTNDEIDTICDLWSKETGFELEDSYVVDTFNFDVNNYILNLLKLKDVKDENGKETTIAVPSLKNKGSYVSQYGVSPLKQRSLAFTIGNGIIGDAVTNYLLYKKPLRETIENEKLAYKFATVVKISKSYPYLLTFKRDEKGKIILGQLEDKINRFFAVKNGTSYRKFNPEKILNIPLSLKGIIKYFDEKHEKIPQFYNIMSEIQNKYLKTNEFNSELFDSYKGLINFNKKGKSYNIDFMQEYIKEDWISKKKEELKVSTTLEVLYKKGKNDNWISPSKRLLRTFIYKINIDLKDESYTITRFMKKYKFTNHIEQIKNLEELKIYLANNFNVNNFDESLYINNVYDGKYYIYDGYLFVLDEEPTEVIKYHKYEGEKISTLAGDNDSHAIYNHSLYDNYDKNYNLSDENSLTIDDLNLDIDYDAYESAAIQYLEKKAGMIYLKMRSQYPNLVIPTLDKKLEENLLKVKKKDMNRNLALEKIEIKRDKTIFEVSKIKLKR